MNSKPVSLKELPEAVATYMAIRERLANLDWTKTFERDMEHEHMERLMDLMQEQTNYIQKRFWNMVDAAQKIKDAEIIREMMDAKRELIESTIGWADVSNARVVA